MTPIDLIVWTLTWCAVIAASAVTLTIAVGVVIGVVRSLRPNRRKQSQSTEIMRGGDDD